MEWEQQVNDGLRWGANVSYATSKDTRRRGFEKATPDGLAKWLGNVYVLARPARNVILSGRLHRVGEITAGANDVDGYNRLDLTASFPRLPVKGMTIRAGLKNALDAEVNYVVVLPSGPQISLHEPRRWWIRAAYDL